MDRIQFALLVAWIVRSSGWQMDRFDLLELEKFVAEKLMDPTRTITMLTAMANRDKIAAIKELRTITGLGLKESKDLIEGAINGTQAFSEPVLTVR